MRKLCPNFDREDGLETVLEVPIPEEMFTTMGGGEDNNNINNNNNNNNNALRWQNMRIWLKSQSAHKLSTSTPPLSGRNADLQFILNVVGSPLIPLQINNDSTIKCPRIRGTSIEASTAKYIVQQYTAATGGQTALNSVNSMYAIGQVRITSSEFHLSESDVTVKARDHAEIGGFVLWQKNPDLWYLELVVSGCKVSAGSDGKVAWRQYAAQQSRASKGPPRPLRRFFQGLDPRSTANLFLDAMCIGEMIINNEDCFILKLEASAATLRARNTDNIENIHHTIWGYFSQRSGLLMKFEDSHLLSMKKGKGNDNIFWETSMESVIEDYRYIDGINIAHRGKTLVTLLRYGEGSTNHKRKMEETWTIEEVDFNICGLTMDCFLPPADLKSE